VKDAAPSAARVRAVLVALDGDERPARTLAVGVACLVGAFMIAIALNWSGFRLGAAALQAG